MAPYTLPPAGLSMRQSRKSPKTRETMAEFVEFKEFKGDKMLVNVEHLIKVQSDDEGTYLYFDVATGNNSSNGLFILHVAESYSVVKRKLQQ